MIHGLSPGNYVDIPETYERARNYKTEWRRERTPDPTFSGETADFRHLDMQAFVS